MEQIILSGLTLVQFKGIITDTIKEVYEQKGQSKKEVSQSAKEAKYFTRKETAKLLHISLPTLNEWTKDGTLTSYRIGTRVLYKPDEVMETVKQRNFTTIQKNNSAK
jgi:excisionase family DNA binding protein